MDQKEQKKLNKELMKVENLENLEKIQLLVSQGADVNIGNGVPLRHAAEYGNLNIVKYLVEHGADIYVKKDTDDSLRWAAKRGNLEVVKYLVEQGANIHAQNDKLLKLVSRNEKMNIVQYLLFDCQMKVKQETKNELFEKTLQLLEKRDALFQLQLSKKNTSNEKINKPLKAKT